MSFLSKLGVASKLSRLVACFADRASLFLAVRQFMLAENCAAPQATSERYAPFNERNRDRFIASVQR
jgi:hypothetical protein